MALTAQAPIGAHDGLDGSRLRVVDVGGVPTRVYDTGEGEPLLLIHGGWFGSLYSLDCWSLNLPELARNFRVVAFDKPGQGHSGNPGSDAEFTFEALLAHTNKLLDELALGPAHLVGHSMGALLAARLALDRPERARTLVAVDSNTLAPDDPRFPRSKFYLDLAKATPPGTPTRETVRMEPDTQSFSRAHVTDDFVDRLFEIALRPEHLHAAARAPELRDTVWGPSLEKARAHALAAIDARGLPIPTLVVWGANDISAPLPLAHSLYERIAAKTEEAELHVVARAGHYVFREQPTAFARTVAAFCGSRN